MMAYHWRRTRVKICGLTRPDDAEAAVNLGADAIGLVFYPSSPRAVSVECGRAIVANIAPFVTVVGLFVDAAASDVREVLSQSRVDLLQFHGDEAPDYCASFDRPYIKAVRMRPDLDLEVEFSRFPHAQALLLDAYQPDTKGGTGQSFEWRRAVSPSGRQMILAGGLTPENIGSALGLSKAGAVDVSSGVESTKGIKDAVKMAEFLKEVYAFDYRQRSR